VVVVIFTFTIFGGVQELLWWPVNRVLKGSVILKSPTTAVQDFTIFSELEHCFCGP
jgi:hypothetical protein